MAEKATKPVDINTKNFHTFNNYCNAFANFYGRISAGEAYWIIGQQNVAKFSREEFVDFLFVAHAAREFNKGHGEDECFRVYLRSELFVGASSDLYDAEIINASIGKNDQYYEIEARSGDYPIYVPPKAELLRYKDPWYTDPTSEMKELAKWIIDHQKDIGVSPVKLDDIYAQEYRIRSYSSVSELLRMILDLIYLQTDRQMVSQMEDEASSLLNQVIRVTRTWRLRGHTPAEVERIKWQRDLSKYIAR